MPFPKWLFIRRRASSSAMTPVVIPTGNENHEHFRDQGKTYLGSTPHGGELPHHPETTGPMLPLQSHQKPLGSTAKP
jgi:hypothetical protein